MPELKRKQVRVYLDEDSEKRLAKLLKGTRTYSETQIITEMVAAALEACEKHGRIPLSVNFEVVDPMHPPSFSATRLNETDKKRT